MSKRKKKLGCLKVLLFSVLGMLMIPLLWLAVNFRPAVADGQPLVSVSSETTRITEPLDDNGDVDYLEAINIRQSKGVTAENNAAVLYTRAWGNAGYEPEAFFDEFLARLELDKSSFVDTPFIEFTPWSNSEYERLSIDRFALEYSSPDNIQAQFDYIVNEYAPWSAEQFPSVDRWLQDNHDAMEVMRSATKRERCNFPLVSKTAPKMLGALLPHAQKMRDCARYFIVSATKHLQQGNVDLFLADLRCIERMSDHLSRGPTIVEYLVSSALLRMVLGQAEKACVSDLKSEDLGKVIAFVSNIEISHDLAANIDNCERFLVLDAAVSTGRGASPNVPALAANCVDWGPALVFLNAELDRVVEICKIKDPAEFRQRSKEAEDRLREFESQALGESSKAALLGGRAAKGRLMGKLLTSQMTPAFTGPGQTESKVRSVREMTVIALAVSAFKVDQGQLPDNLQQLVPDYLDALPNETYTNTAFQYLKTETEAGFQIHSTEWVDGELKPERTKFVAPAIKAFKDYLN